MKLNTLTQRVLREFKKSNAAPVEVVINHAGGELSSRSSSSNSTSNSSPPVIATEEIVEEEVIDNDGGREIGRPLGSSKDKKKADADNLKSCMNEITYDYATKLTSLKVDYINNESHPWKVCLGVPYATTLWQVGDASEQNGKFKSEWYREKDEYTGCEEEM